MKEPNAKKNACWVPKIVVIKLKNFNYFTEIVYGSNPYSPKLLKFLFIFIFINCILYSYFQFVHRYIVIYTFV